MLTEERQKIIVEAVNQKNMVKLQDLMDLTGASESTIRRDLTQLEQSRYLKRVHGGAAKLQNKLEEMTISEKTDKNAHEKKIIAKYAANLVQQRDCIFLDAGTTTNLMIPYLKEKEIVVVTNGLMHLNDLLRFGIKTYVVGGLVKESTGAIIGSNAITSLKQYRFDKCFMGTNGVHMEFGFTTPDPEEAKIKKEAMALSRECYILADSTKLGEISFSAIGQLDEATIISNETNEEQLENLREKTILKVVSS